MPNAFQLLPAPDNFQVWDAIRRACHQALNTAQIESELVKGISFDGESDFWLFFLPFK